jgi:transposase InsO family protein
MVQVLHGCAKTTHAVRAELQRSQASAAALAERFGINPKTVLKWRKRESVLDCPMGPKEARSTVLTPLEEAAIVAFHKQTLLPLDDVLFALQPSIPRLTRSSLHRLPERHGISRLPRDASGRSARNRFKSYPIGFFHIDICEVRCAEGKLFLYVAIDRTSKLVHAELHTQATRSVATQMLSNLLQIAYRIHIVLTDNGIQFTHTPGTSTSSVHAFDRVCRAHGIEHRLTQPNHPLGDPMIAVPAGTDRQLCCRWTDGQVERMNRTIKEATVRTFHYASADELERHLDAFLLAYNHARRLKTLKGKTPYDFICHQCTVEPQHFRLDPHHHSPGPNT